MCAMLARLCAFLVLAVPALLAMPLLRAKKNPSFARLSPLSRGRIIGMRATHSLNRHLSLSVMDTV